MNAAGHDQAQVWGTRRVWISPSAVTTFGTREQALAAAAAPAEPGHRVEVVVQEAAGGSWSVVPVLPPLEQPCPDCSPAAVQAQLQAAYTAWRDAHPTADLQEWTSSAVCRELMADEPDRPDTGCVACDWTGARLTVAGEQLLTFLSRRQPARPR